MKETESQTQELTGLKRSFWPPRWHSGKESTWVQSLGGEDPREEEMKTTPVFLPGKLHGQRSLMGYSPWGCRVRHDLVTGPSPLILKLQQQSDETEKCLE